MKGTIFQLFYIIFSHYKLENVKTSLHPREHCAQVTIPVENSSGAYYKTSLT